MAVAKKDVNSVAVSLGVSDLDGITPLQLRINPTTGRLLVSAVLGGTYMTNPMTTLGDMVYEDATPAPARLAGNTTTTRKFLRQTGTGTASAVPAWDTLQAGDIPDISATYETKSNKATTFGTINDTLYPTVKAVNDAIISAVVGLLDYRGTYDASGNTFPATGGSGTAGAILKGDFWIISVGGTLGTTVVYSGDMVIALQDTPGQTASNWNIIEYGISYVPENAANKVTSISGSSTDTQYPSAKLLYDQLALKLSLSGGTMTGKVTSAGRDEVGKTYTPATGSQTVALDCSVNNMHIVTGHADGTAITFTVANATNSQPFIVSILQGANTPSTIAGWFATVRWAGGSAPTLTATVNKRDTFGFIRTGTNTYDGFVIGQNC